MPEAGADSRAVRPVVLVFVDYYLPGYKGGGPVRTVMHMVEQLSRDVDFRLVTRDHDAYEAAAYPGIERGRWYDVGNARVLYLSPAELHAARLRDVVREVQPDVLYLNSLFSSMTLRALLLRRIGVGAPRVVLAPRGELHEGALATGRWPAYVPRRIAAHVPAPKRLKKLLYVAAARVLGLLSGVTWHASSDDERASIYRHAGAGADVRVAPNLGTTIVRHADEPRVAKAPGSLRVMFVSRIEPKKNLAGAIDMLGDVQGRVTFDIYGPVQDERYWDTCKAAISALPPNVVATHHGAIPPVSVAEAFCTHHLLLFPTFGENFGHVILEALAQGCPVLISDQTPWKGLQGAAVGWDLPLVDVAAFRGAIQRCVELDQHAFRSMSVRAAQYAQTHIRDDERILRNLALFSDRSHAVAHLRNDTSS